MKWLRRDRRENAAQICTFVLPHIQQTKLKLLHKKIDVYHHSFLLFSRFLMLYNDQIVLLLYILRERPKGTVYSLLRAGTTTLHYSVILRTPLFNTFQWGRSGLFELYFMHFFKELRFFEKSFVICRPTLSTQLGRRITAALLDPCEVFGPGFCRTENNKLTLHKLHRILIYIFQSLFLFFLLLYPDFFIIYISATTVSL